MEHLHAELLVVGERIVQLRVDLERRAADVKEAMSDACGLARRITSEGHGLHGWAQFNSTCKLKGKIRM